MRHQREGGRVPFLGIDGVLFGDEPFLQLLERVGEGASAFVHLVAGAGAARHVVEAFFQQAFVHALARDPLQQQLSLMLQLAACSLVGGKRLNAVFHVVQG